MTDRWHHVHTKIAVIGVGFFDFPHGQSGVAPNAIELHPVLAVQFGGKAPVVSGSGTAPKPKPTVKPSSRPSSGSFFVRASVSPNPMPYGAHPTLTAQSVPGASCSASVVYSTGRSPVSFDGSALTVPRSGNVSWSWHQETSGSGGTATVSCTYRGQSKQVMAGFSVTH